MDKTVFRVTRGFTLVEVLIVVAILGILSAIALSNLGEYRLRAVLSDIGQAHGRITNALGIYYSEQSDWPNAGDSDKNVILLGLDNPESLSELFSSVEIADGAIVTITLVSDSQLGALSGAQYRLEPLSTVPIRFECKAEAEVDRLLGPFCVPR